MFLELFDLPCHCALLFSRVATVESVRESYFTGTEFPCPGAMFWAAVSAFRRDFCNRAGNVACSSFRRVSEETLGSFSAILCGFSVLHWHGVSLSGSHVLGFRVCFSSCFFATVLATSLLAFHWHGVSLSGRHVLGCLVCFISAGFCSRAGNVFSCLF